MKKTANMFLVGLFLGAVSSQSLMDLFLVLTTCFGLYLTLLAHQKVTLDSSFKKKWLYFSLPWFLWIALGLFIKAPPGAPIGQALKDFLWLLQLPLLVVLWQVSKPNLKFSQYLCFILCLVAAYAVAIYFLGFDPLQQNWSDRTENLKTFWRTGGLFSNAMALAQSYGPLVALLLPLSIYDVSLILHNRPRDLNGRWLRPLTLTLAVLAVLLTFTRGVWLSLIVASIVGSFLFDRRFGIRALLSMALVGTTIFVAWPKFRERALQTFDAKKSYDSERIVLWKTNWHIFVENPWMGIGYGENKRRLREYYDILGVPPGQFEGHAHNQYLHFLAGTGVIGTVFFLACCAWLFFVTLKLYQRYRREYNVELSLLCLGLLMAQITFHFGAITEANFAIAKNRILLVYMWSFIFYLKDWEKVND